LEVRYDARKKSRRNEEKEAKRFPALPEEKEEKIVDSVKVDEIINLLGAG